jgi:putative intracellular protease/amidase
VTADPVRDIKGLRLAPDAPITDAPQLDVLHVPGGRGQQALMEDANVLGWIRRQAAHARIFSVCTGALICGAAARQFSRQGNPMIDLAHGHTFTNAMRRKDLDAMLTHMEDASC